MAMIFPSPMINDVRKALTAGTEVPKRDIRFPGTYLGSPRIAPSPGQIPVGKVMAEVCCSSCGRVLPEGLPVIEFGYDIFPDDGRSVQEKYWIHIEKCQHVGG